MSLTDEQIKTMNLEFGIPLCSYREQNYGLRKVNLIEANGNIYLGAGRDLDMSFGDSTGDTLIPYLKELNGGLELMSRAPEIRESRLGLVILNYLPVEPVFLNTVDRTIHVYDSMSTVIRPQLEEELQKLVKKSDWELGNCMPYDHPRKLAGNLTQFQRFLMPKRIVYHIGDLTWQTTVPISIRTD